MMLRIKIPGEVIQIRDESDFVSLSRSFTSIRPPRSIENETTDGPFWLLSWNHDSNLPRPL